LPSSGTLGADRPDQRLQGYGDAEYLKATSDLKNWYDTYRWKVGTPSSRALSDESVGETETA